MAVLPPAPLPACPTPACAAASPLPAARPLRGDHTACPRTAPAVTPGRRLPRRSPPAARRPGAPCLPGAVCRDSLPGLVRCVLSPRSPSGGSGQLWPYRTRVSAAVPGARSPAAICRAAPSWQAAAGAARAGAAPSLTFPKAVLKQERRFSSSGRRRARHGPGAHRPFYHQGSDGLRTSGCVLRAPAGARRVGARGWPGVSRRRPNGYRDRSLPV